MAATNSDWLTPGVANTTADAKFAVANDIQDAFISLGQKGRNLTAADLAALDALGYGGKNIGNSANAEPSGDRFQSRRSHGRSGAWYCLDGVLRTGRVGLRAMPTCRLNRAPAGLPRRFPHVA